MKPGFANSDGKGGMAGHLSMLAAWGVAFGCAVGWDAFTLPGETFLPKAGPLGTLLGLLIGGLAMGVVAWNYHCMVKRHPGPGGVYAYATEAFGSDHGFICAWFLCLTYIAIAWADATALVIVARYLLGDFLHFGFAYTVAGVEVTLGNILVSAAGIALAAAVCCRRALSGRVQAALALVLAGGIALCFCAAAAKHGGGGLRSMQPAFSPLAGKGAGPLGQVLAIVALSPWLFVGFESISALSGEFRFPPDRAFAVMAAALGAAVAAYAMLTAIPAMVPLAHAGDWSEGLARLAGGRYPGFEVSARSLGGAGTWVMAAVLLSAIFTNLVGNTMAAGRLLSAMADDGALPGWFGGRTRDGAPKNAVLAIAAVSLGIAALGRTVIDIIVDIAVVGAGIAYAYTSAAAWKAAREEGNRAGKVLGLCGLAFSVAISAAFVLPNVGSGTASMATESYLVVVLWCIAGLVSFVYVFTHDGRRRFGQSTVVWVSLLAIVLLMSGLWIRETTYETTAAAFEDIIRHHADVCMPAALDAAGGEYWVSGDAADGGAEPPDEDWRETLRSKLVTVNRSIVRNSLVQVGLAVLAFGLMFCLYSILRRRERDLEREKARAKSYFFSTVSHDIRTPLNAIIGFSEMLKAGFRTEEEREQAIESILVSGRTLLGLINDVLDLSKLESGKMEIMPEPTDCPRLLRGVVDAFRVAGAKPEVDLRCRTGEMPPLMLDPQRLRQIVFNLLGNAVKFTERGHVEVRASYAGGEFRLEVEDTGCGIGQEDIKRLGGAYVQLGAKAARNGGTGLGLAICGQLAAAMGGRIGVESEPGKGSAFSLVIPGVKAADKETLRERERQESEGGLPAHKVGSGRPVKRILLVDDSKINLMVLKAHLNHLGNYEIALAADGQEALSILEAPGAPAFDLVLTDMWMPNLGGDGLVKAIRANPKLAGLRVVIVTADVEMGASADSMGFDGLLFKPVTGDKLAQCIGMGA